MEPYKITIKPKFNTGRRIIIDGTTQELAIDDFLLGLRIPPSKKILFSDIYRLVGSKGQVIGNIFFRGRVVTALQYELRFSTKQGETIKIACITQKPNRLTYQFNSKADTRMNEGEELEKKIRTLIGLPEDYDTITTPRWRR